MIKTIKWTVLKGYFLVYLICCSIFTLIKWETLSNSGGWGVIYMFGLIVIGLLGLFIDFILASIIKEKKIFRIIEILIALVFSILLFIELKNNGFN